MERSAWPSISWTLRRSAPPSSRCVANEWRSRCGWTRCGSSPAFSASRRRIRKAPARVSGPPRAFRKSSGPVAAVEVRPAHRDVAAQRVDRGPAERDDPLLRRPCRARARAGRRGRPSGACEADRLADAEAGAVHQLDERAVAHRARRRPVRGLDQALGLGRARASAAACAGGAAARSAAAGLSSRAPSSSWCRKKERRAATRRATVEAREPRGAHARRASARAPRSSSCRRARRRQRRELRQVAPVRVDRARRPPRRRAAARKPSSSGSGAVVSGRVPIPRRRRGPLYDRGWEQS